MLLSKKKIMEDLVEMMIDSPADSPFSIKPTKGLF